VVVATLRNDLDILNKEIPILSYFPQGKMFQQKSFYLGSNAITIHDPEVVLHRVNPIDLSQFKGLDKLGFNDKNPLKRVIMVIFQLYTSKGAGNEVYNRQCSPSPNGFIREKNVFHLKMWISIYKNFKKQNYRSSFFGHYSHYVCMCNRSNKIKRLIK
jgi:hypothetical protein